MAKKWAGLRQDTSVKRLKSTVEYLGQDVAALHQRLKVVNSAIRVMKEDHLQLTSAFESFIAQQHGKK